MRIESYAAGAAAATNTATRSGQVYAQSGDTLHDIAQRYGVDTEALRAANPDLPERLITAQAVQLPAHPPAQDESLGSAPLAAGTVGSITLGKPINHDGRAMEGFRKADGLSKGQAAPDGSFTKLAEKAYERASPRRGVSAETADKVRNALKKIGMQDKAVEKIVEAIRTRTSDLSPVEAAQAKDALRRVGAGLLAEKIEPEINGALKKHIERLGPPETQEHASTATGKTKPASNPMDDFKGAVAQLTRTGQHALDPELTPATKVAHDVAAGQDMKGSGLPKVDAKLHAEVDLDTLRMTGKDPSILHAESVKHGMGTLATTANSTKAQLARQQAWREAGTPDQPRKMGFYALSEPGETGFPNLTSPPNLDALAKAVGNEADRAITIGQRRYSVGELREMGQNAVSKATSSGDFARFKTQWESAHPGEKFTANTFYKAQVPTPEAAMKYLGRQFGEPAPETAALPRTELGSVKHGAVTGAAVSGVVTLIRLSADGKLSLHSAGEVAREAAVGAGAGAVAARAERVVTPVMDKVVGGVIERGAAKAQALRSGVTATEAAEAGAAARAIGSRALGGTVVGTVVSAGFSVYENRKGLMRGDSQAIGHVSADVVVGAAATASGIAAGAAAGAAFGSVVPVAGTIVGAAVGAGVAWLANSSGARDAISNAASSAVDKLKSWF